MSKAIGAFCCAFVLLCAPASAATDGQLLAVVRTSGGDRLITFNPDGSGIRTVLSGQRLSSPGWSPDGNRIVVADGHRVLVLELATGATRTVIDAEGAAAPAWSPDGARLALLRGADPVTMRLDGSDARSLSIPFSGQISWLSWSPDGARVAYGNSGTLRTIALDGSDDRPLATATNLGDPAWSPDSARIAYRDDGRLRIAAASGDGAPVDLTRTGGVEPDWSPDGREVVYAFGAGVRATAVDGGASRGIVVPTDGQTLVAEPDWQPCVPGVTLSCSSSAATPAAPSVPAPGPGPGVPPAVAPPARAPYLSAVATPRLDRRGRGWLRVRCDADCSVSLRLVVRLRDDGTIVGRSLARTLAAGHVMQLRLRAPDSRRLRSAWVRGTVKGRTGRARSVRIPVNVR
jgi:Tol biopolymer transport system component